MKWKIKDIGTHCNILIDDPNVPDEDKKLVGVGYPHHIAKRIVDMHNKDIEKLTGN